MEIAQVLAGFTLGQADNLRRAMGKKKKSELDKQYVGFEAGMLERGYSKAAISTLWEILVPFADYAFNKAHSAAYGVVSYWTAYLKAHYPGEYMAALLTSVKGDKDKSAVYLGECRRLGITVLPPDVNDSIGNFASVGDDIRFGLTAVRNVGANVVAKIEEARQEKGAFTSFTDFLDKVDAGVCNKRTVDSLVRSGAFDSLGHQRRSLAAIVEDAVDQYAALKKNSDFQDSLFGGTEDAQVGVSVTVPDVAEWEKTQLLAFEREMLGLYVSDHPLAGLEEVLKASSDCSIGALHTDTERPDGSVVKICGLVTSVQRRISKKGDSWASVTIEDREGSIDVMVFPAAYKLASPILVPDSIVVMKARVRRSDDSLDLSATEVTKPVAGQGRGDTPLVVSMPITRCTPDLVEQFKQVLSSHPGMTEVHVRLQRPGKVKTMRLGKAPKVSTSSALIADLKELLGPGCLQ